jgi:hypothetical protein
MHAPPMTLSPAQLDALAAWAQLTLYRVRAERATARKQPAPARASRPTDLRDRATAVQDNPGATQGQPT